MNFKNKKIKKIIGLFCLIFVMFFLGAFSYVYLLSKSIEKINLERITSFNYRIPCSITMFGRSSQTISARINIFSFDSSHFYTLERSWQGWELIFDCVLVQISSGWLVFPYSIYTDVTKSSKGLNITKYYDYKNLPIIYDFSYITEKEKKDLKRIFSFVKAQRILPNFFKTFKVAQISIRNFEVGKEYFIKVDTSGHLNIVEN